MAGEGGQAQYRQLAADLRERIEAGEFRPGDRLPTNVELAEASGLTRVTVQQAIKLLKAEGVVETRRGGGTVVAPPHAGLACVLLDRPQEAPQACLFYGLSVDEVVQELVDAEAQGAPLPSELVAITPRGDKDTFVGTPSINGVGQSLQSGVMGLMTAPPKGSAGDPRQGMRSRLEVHPEEVVPGYRIAVVEYGLDEQSQRRTPAAIVYVPDPQAGKIRPVPTGGLGPRDTRQVRSWLTSQVKSARRNK